MVEADFPLLVGNVTMDAAGGALFWQEGMVRFLGNYLPARRTTSGHFAITIDTPHKGVQFEKSTTGLKLDEEVLVAGVLMKEKVLTKKEVDKLHHQFGHGKTKRIAQLIKNANKMTTEIQSWLDEIDEKCIACMRDQKSKPLPLTSLPRATRFNEVVTLDLKDYDEG